jgi:hypothetical protein
MISSKLTWQALKRNDLTGQAESHRNNKSSFISSVQLQYDNGPNHDQAADNLQRDHYFA